MIKLFINYKSIYKQHKLEAAFLDDKPHQYYKSLYEDRNEMFRHAPYSLEERLVDAVARGNKELAIEMLGEIGNYGSKAVLASDPLRSAKNSLICSCAFLARAVIRAGISSDESFALSDAAIRHIEELDSIKSVLSYEQEVLLQFLSLVDKKVRRELSPIVAAATNFINARLSDKISLRDVASHIGVHPVYLSKKFREESGQTITAYINFRKVEESVWFVRNTNRSIADISAMYGFSSQGYYITLFRKYFGVTPGEMRSNSAIIG